MHNENKNNIYDMRQVCVHWRGEDMAIEFGTYFFLELPGYFVHAKNSYVAAVKIKLFCCLVNV